MSEPEDLEARVAGLEGEVADLNSRVQRSEQDAAAARVLAGGADRDVADLGGEFRELRGEVREFRSEILWEVGDLRGEFRDFRDQNNRVLNVMREDLTGLRERVETGFSMADEKFIGIRGRLDAAAAGQQQIVGLLTTLIERDDTNGS